MTSLVHSVGIPQNFSLSVSPTFPCSQFHVSPSPTTTRYFFLTSLLPGWWLLKNMFLLLQDTIPIFLRNFSLIIAHFPFHVLICIVTQLLPTSVPFASTPLIPSFCLISEQNHLANLLWFNSTLTNLSLYLFSWTRLGKKYITVPAVLHYNLCCFSLAPTTYWQSYCLLLSHPWMAAYTFFLQSSNPFCPMIPSSGQLCILFIWENRRPDVENFDSVLPATSICAHGLFFPCYE